MLAASAPRSVIAVGEQYLHCAGAPLVAAREQRILPACQREAMGEDRRAVEAAALDQIEVDLHGVPAPSLELLDAEGVRADQLDLLEVQRRPFEAPGHLDAGHHDGATWGHHPDADLQ